MSYSAAYNRVSLLNRKIQNQQNAVCRKLILDNWEFLCLFRGFCVCFVTHLSFYVEKLLVLPPTPQAGRPTLVGCPRLLIQYIRSYSPSAT